MARVVRPKKTLRPDLGADEDPEVGRQRAALLYFVGEILDDILGDLGEREGQQRDDDAKDQPPGNDGRARVPQDLENGRHVLERGNAFTPWALLVVVSCVAGVAAVKKEDLVPGRDEVAIPS